MALKIITDSACDLPKWFSEKYNIKVIPTPVVIKEKDYFDGETIMPETFYDLLRTGEDVKTYHINADMFRRNFEPYAQNDELIYICFSTGIAGTYNAANLAKTELLEEYENFDLTIIDGKNASIGFGLIVYYAALMLNNNCDKQTIIDAINYNIEHMQTYFTVETLEYLFKGGRLSRTSAIAGGVLDIKPIIKVDEEGKLSAIEKVRKRKRSVARLVDIVGEKGVDLKNQTIGLVHGDDIGTLNTIKNMLQEKYGCQHFIENYVGCAIGAHTGPGIVGIAFLDEESPYSKYYNSVK